MRFRIALYGWLLCLPTALRGAQSTPPGAMAPEAGVLSIDAGEKLVIELETSLHTRSTRKGDKAAFRVLRDVRVGDRVALPRGSVVQGTVTLAKRAGRIAGRSEIRLRLDDVRLPDGTSSPLAASIVRVGVSPVEKAKDSDPKVRGESGSGGSPAAVLHGGMQGAVIGILGGGARGAMYGGAIGAGVGLAQVLLQRGPDVDLPRNTIFEARFDRRLDIPTETARRAAEIAGRTGAPSAGALRIPEEEPLPELRDVRRPALTRRTPAQTPPPAETVTIEPPPPAPEPPAPAPAPRSEASAEPRCLQAEHRGSTGAGRCAGARSQGQAHGQPYPRGFPAV